MKKTVIKDFSQLSYLIENNNSFTVENNKSKSNENLQEVINKIPKQKKLVIDSTLKIKQNKEDTHAIEIIKEKEEYQKAWAEKDFILKKMIAKKNRRWLEENKHQSDFTEYEENKDVYKNISSFFFNENKRKWIIHIITNFLPLNKSRQVPKLPINKNICPFSSLELTSIKDIKIGDRNKHLAYIGENTNVVLSGIALQELYRFVINYTYDFYSREGQIINFCIDEIRNKK